MFVGRACVVALALVAGARAAPEEDKVDVLPGWDAPLPSAWYSGFVNVSGDFGDASMHYVRRLALCLPVERRRASSSI